MAKKLPAAGAAVNGGTIKVRAIAVGFYGDVRRRVGDVFTLYPRTGTFTAVVTDKEGEPKLTKGTLVEHRVTEEVPDTTLPAEAQFNPKWMETVAADTPERAMSAQERIRQEHDEILAARLGGKPAGATGDAAVLGDD
jgi:hypothetical protein